MVPGDVGGEGVCLGCLMWDGADFMLEGRGVCSSGTVTVEVEESPDLVAGFVEWWVGTVGLGMDAVYRTDDIVAWDGTTMRVEADAVEDFRPGQLALSEGCGGD